MKPRIVIITIVLLCVSALGGWFWYGKKTSQQTTSSQPQKSQEADLAADEVWYPIPELGIKMKLNKEFAADLVYEYISTQNTEGVQLEDVSFTTKFLQSIDEEYCSSRFGPLGTIVKITNQNVEKILKNKESVYNNKNYINV